MASATLYLASASPRRRELLSQIGVLFELLQVQVDETPKSQESPVEYVRRLAMSKAEAGWLQSEKAKGLPVLGADTTVVCDGQILGKPADEQQALDMLQQLSGRRHQVLSAVALVQGAQVACAHVVTEVCFRRLKRAECIDYWRTGEPCDKAGGYGIQGRGAVFVERIEGSYSNVVGLPLMETAQLLEKFDVPIWQTHPV